MSNELQLLLSEIQYRLKLSQEEIADKIGYTRPYLTKAIKKGSSAKVLKALKEKFPEIAQIVLSEHKPPPVQPKSLETPVNRSDEALNKLIEMNLISTKSLFNFSEAHLLFAKSELNVTTSNAQLTGMLQEQRPPGLNDLQTLQVVATKWLELADFVAEIGSGAKFASKEEALQALDKRISQQRKADKKGVLSKRSN